MESPERDWRCPHCGRAHNTRKRDPANFIGRHVYLFGPPRCTPCAFHFHAAVPHDPELLGHEEDR